MNAYQTPTQNQRKRPKFLITLAFLVLSISASVLYYQYAPAATADGGHAGRGRHGHHGHDEDTPEVVAIETARQADFPVFVNGLGTVTALKTVTVKPRVDGELQKLNFTEGQMVQAGDLLAEIDPRPFQVQLQQAQGQLLRDEALLKNAELDHSRYQTLQEQDSIASQQTASQSALVKQYQGTVEMDKAQLNNARLQLSYSRLTAPISGRLGLRQLDQGNIIHANDANGLVVITQTQPISVVFTLPEDKVQTLVERWRTGKPVSVYAYDRAGKNKLAEGRLTALDNQIDASTGTLKLKALFDNHEQSLFANQFVNIKMHLDTLSDVTLVSSAAIQHDSQGPFVYVATAENTAQIRRITLGPVSSVEDKTVVLNQLAANETIIVEGVDRLKEGSRIDIAEKDGVAVAATTDTANKPEHKTAKRNRHS